MNGEADLPPAAPACVGECMFTKVAGKWVADSGNSCQNPSTCECSSPPGSAEGSDGDIRFIPCIRKVGLRNARPPKAREWFGGAAIRVPFFFRPEIGPATRLHPIPAARKVCLQISSDERAAGAYGVGTLLLLFW